MDFRKESAFVGAFVLLAAIISIGVLFFILGYDFNQNRTDYVFRFSKSSGIKEGSKIMLKGFQIGEIIRMEPTFSSNIYFKAWAKIDRNLQLYRGTRGVITNQNVIGDASIELKLPREKEYLLREGDTIFVSQTQNLDELISSMSALTNNLNNLVSSLGTIAGSNEAGIGQIVAGVNGILNKVNRILATSEGSVVEILANMSATTRTLRRFARDIRRNPLILLQGNKKQ